MIYVYIAGPMTHGDFSENLRQAVRVATETRREGFVPFVPQLGFFWHLISPANRESWLAYDIAWLRKCDALLRLPGASEGADEEEKVARLIGLPVFGSEGGRVVDAMYRLFVHFPSRVRE